MLFEAHTIALWLGRFYTIIQNDHYTFKCVTQRFPLPILQLKT